MAAIFPDDIFKMIFMNENLCISIKISLKIVLINHIQALAQIMGWRRPGDKPLSEPIVVRLMTHVCITRSQWVKLKSREISFAHDLLLICPIVQISKWYATEMYMVDEREIIFSLRLVWHGLLIL